MNGQKKRLYVSIPYTGHEADFPKRCEKARDKYSKDYNVITPKQIIRDSSIPYNICMGKCIEALLDCDEVLFADGWSESKGCSLEMGACMIYNKPYKTDAQI